MTKKRYLRYFYSFPLASQADKPMSLGGLDSRCARKALSQSRCEVNKPSRSRASLAPNIALSRISNDGLIIDSNFIFSLHLPIDHSASILLSPTYNSIHKADARWVRIPIIRDLVSCKPNAPGIFRMAVLVSRSFVSRLTPDQPFPPRCYARTRVDEPGPT